MSTQHIPFAHKMPGEMKEDGNHEGGVEITQSTKKFPLVCSKNVIFDDVELSWTDTSFDTSISTSVSDCNPANENVIMTATSREGPPDGESSPRRNVTSSSRRYASKSQLHVDSDAEEVHLELADPKIQKKIQPNSNDNYNPQSQRTDIVSIETMDSSNFPSASHDVSINLMSDFEKAIDEEDHKEIQVPIRIHPPSSRIKPETSETEALQQHQIPLSPSRPPYSKMGSRSTSIQRQVVLNATSQYSMEADKIRLPMEINIDDSSSCDSVSNLDDTSSKKLSPCSSSSFDSRESIISADDENRPTTPKAKRSTRTAAAIVTPDPPNMASPVLTKGMADYVLGDAERLPGSNDGNFIFTKEMFDYIMGNEDEDSTVTGSDLIIDEPRANGIGEHLQEVSGPSVSNDHITSIDNKIMKKGEPGGTNRNSRHSSHETEFSSKAKECIGNEYENAVPATSPKVFRFKPSENRDRDSSLTPSIEDKPGREEGIIFVPPVVQTTKTSPPRKSTKVRRRTSYQIKHPTIYEDCAFEDSSIRRSKAVVVNKSPKRVRWQTPPPSMPTLSSTPSPSLYEAASIQELACFISPDVGSLRDRRGKRRCRSKRRSALAAKYTYLLVVSIGVVLACLKVVDIIPGLSSKIVALHNELSISGPEGRLHFFVDKPAEEPPTLLPKNKIARAWRKFRSRKQRRNEE